jgi:hypothetical protein
MLFAIEFLPERLALDEGHDVIEEGICFAGLVQRQDMGMLEIRCDLDLLEEPLGTENGSKLGPRDF